MNAKTIVQHLEKSGLRYTPQRYSVLSFLTKHSGHPTAEEIYEGVNRPDELSAESSESAGPRSSRATTYNNLRDLVQAGLVREVAVEGRAARYDAKFIEHHHFICDDCGTVEDMEWYEVPTPAASSLGKRVVRQCELIVRGVCAACAPHHGKARPAA